jgi:hypothetical protein
MPLLCGNKLLVQYDGGDELHERIILGHVSGSSYWVITPDNDVYEEDYGAGNPDVSAVRFLLNEELPPGVEAADCYRFRGPIAPERLRRLGEEARQVALMRGGQLPVVAPLDLAIEGIAFDVGGLRGRWRVVENTAGGLVVGQVVPEALKPAEVPPMKKALVQWGSEAVAVEWVPEDGWKEWAHVKSPLDSRLLRIRMRGAKRFREWREGVEETSQASFPDWPLKGPRTSQWCLEYLNKQPGGAQDHHQLWRRQTNLKLTDFGVAEHESLMEAVKWGMCYDQTNLSNSAMVEVLLRRAQTIEYAHIHHLRDVPSAGGKEKGSSGGLTYEEQEAFAGTTRDNGVMIAPELLEHVKADVGRNSELTKSLLKAREYREQMQKAGRN